MAKEDTQVTTIERKAAEYSNSLMQWIAEDMANPARSYSMPKDYDWKTEAVVGMLHVALNVKDKNGRLALEVCSPGSIFSAFKRMFLQGLSVARNQCYFIVRGDQLNMMRSYFGTQTVLKRFFPTFRVNANVIHQGDAYSIEYDETNKFHYIAGHKVTLESLDKPIIAAYGNIVDTETGEQIYGLIMTKAEIDKCWSKGQTHNVQNDFPQEMAKRTLINRMCKNYINSPEAKVPSDVVAAFNETTAEEYESDKLQNITPPESEAEKQKLIRGKSKGAAGLSAILDAGRAEAHSPSPESVQGPQDDKSYHPAPDDGLDDETEGNDGELDLGAEGTSVGYDSLPF